MHFHSIRRQGDEKTSLNSDQSPFQAKLKCQVLLSNQPINRCSCRLCWFRTQPDYFRYRYLNSTEFNAGQNPPVLWPDPTKASLSGFQCPGSPTALATLWSAPKKGFYNALGSYLRSKLDLSGLSSRHESLCLSVRETLSNSYWY